MQLAKAGCVVYVANHGVEALDMVRASDIWYEQGQTPKHLDVILMDWEMPIMDGLQASREIRALQKANKITRHIEIIATTANAREEQVETALASGCVSLNPLPQNQSLTSVGLRCIKTIHGQRSAREDSRTSRPDSEQNQRPTIYF
jgi:CheY-like chemotaxis protein